jgi:ABC-type nitrate/sulfonate/bicarbonate transport system substrate-binding protein
MADTRFVQSSTAPDLINLLARGDVEALLIWEPNITALVRSGAGKLLATQQRLWELASGSHATLVHVVYLISPQFVDEHPNLLRDVNDAQAQVAQLWTQGDGRAVQAMHDDGIVETLLAQMRFDRQYGTLLQSDVWTQDSERLRGDMFARVVWTGASPWAAPSAS